MIFHAYLVAYSFWLALAVGALSILMVHNLAGGYWGAVLRRPLEAAATTLPLLALLFIPVLIGIPALYPWIYGDVGTSAQSPDVLGKAAAGAMLGFKQAYLSLPFFLARAVIYFLVWIVLMLLLVRWSRQRDDDPSPELTGRLRNLSAFGLVLMALTVSFAGIDWLMSIDPAWTSSIWGLIVATGGLLTAFAFVTLIVCLRSNRPPFEDVTSPALFNSLGSFMLAFLMLWAYMSISQVILYYAGNLANETIWYVRRTAGGWTLAALGVAFLGFIIPFSFLIIRGAKRNPRILAAVCAVILVSQFLHWYWVVEPTFNDNCFLAAIATAVAGVVIGALWLLAFRWQYGKAPEISPVEPKLIAAREEHETALAEHAAELAAEHAHE